MLREGSHTRTAPLSWRGRTWVLGCLCLTGLGISALRGPAQDAGATAAAASDQRVAVGDGQKVTVKKRPPFVFCRSLPDSAGVFAFRPSEIFSYPGMKPIAEEWTKQMHEALKEMGLDEVIPPIEKIEQITGVIQFTNDPKAPNGHRHAVLGTVPLVRTNEDYDWNTLIDKWKGSEKLVKLICEKVEEIHYEGKTYYKLSKAPMFGGLPDICVGLLDKHTLVLDQEDGVKRVLREGTCTVPQWVREAGWERVENGLAAFAIDNRKQTLTTAVDEDEKPLAGLKTLVEKVTYFVFGADATAEETSFYAFGTLADDKMAEDAAKATQALITLGSVAVDLELKKPHDRVEPTATFAQQFLHQAKVERAADAAGKKTVVHVHSQANLDMKKWIEFLKEAEPEKKK